MHRPSHADLATRPIISRAPDSMPDNLPRSVQVRGAAAILPDTETATQWSPYGFLAATPYFGGYDPQSQRGHGIMQHAQAELYDASPNPWPANGQWDRPNGFWAGLLRLPPSTSAHPGRTLPAGAPGPTMLFHAPPVFSLQTVPIPAVGA